MLAQSRGAGSLECHLPHHAWDSIPWPRYKVVVTNSLPQPYTLSWLDTKVQDLLYLHENSHEASRRHKVQITRT
jgi:hypothetical protein